LAPKSWEDFSHQILDDSHCRIVEHRIRQKGSNDQIGGGDEWYEKIGVDLFPKVPVSRANA